MPFLQPHSFPFLLIERRTVVSYWQNPTPGPFVSIRWEHTTFASGQSTGQKSKCGLSLVTMVQRLSRPFTFSKKYSRGPILVKLRIKHHPGMYVVFWADWIGTLAYIGV